MAGLRQGNTIRRERSVQAANHFSHRAAETGLRPRGCQRWLAADERLVPLFRQWPFCDLLSIVVDALVDG